VIERILFVCTGNTCRSPLAKGLLKWLAEKEALDLDIRSSGVAAIDGMPISHHTKAILADRGIQADETSTAMTRELAEWADLILTMTMSHKRAVVQRFPSTIDKVFTLKEYVEDDPAVLEAIKERESLASELQLKLSLGQAITAEEQERLKQLNAKIPGEDVADPFGGSREDYDRCAMELEGLLVKLVNRLKKETA